jgi:hypothetical protein
MSRNRCIIMSPNHPYHRNPRPNVPRRRALRLLAHGLIGTVLGSLCGALFGLLFAELEAALKAGNVAVMTAALPFAAAGAGAGLLTGLAAALGSGELPAASDPQRRGGATRRLDMGYRFARPVLVVRSVEREGCPVARGPLHKRGPSLN